MAVLEHHDRVVDHQADREHEAEQRQHVDREAQEIQEEHRADQRHRDRDERDQRGAERAQEDEDDEHHQRHRLEHGAVDRVDRFLDEDGGIKGDSDRHALRQSGLQPGHLGLGRLRYRERVGGRLLDDAQAHRRVAVDAHDAALIERAQARLADVFQPHRIAARLGDDHVVELLGVPEIGLGQHGELALRGFDPAGGNLHVLSPQAVLDIGRREAVGGEPVAVDPQAHRVAALAADDHRGDPGQGLQPVGDIAVGVVGELERAVALREQAQPDDRLRVGLDLRDDRIVGGLRQQRAHARDAVAHVVRRGVDVPLEQELDRDLRDLLARDRLDRAHALDAGERVLERLRDLRLHHLRARALVHGAHRDHRRVDLRVFAHRQALERDRADQDDEQGKDRREDRTTNADLGELHLLL